MSGLKDVIKYISMNRDGCPAGTILNHMYPANFNLLMPHQYIFALSYYTVNDYCRLEFKPKYGSIPMW